MYVPEHFALTDPSTLARIIREHPLATLVSQGPAGLDANHLPFDFDPDAGPVGTLRAHVARANPLWREIPDASEVLVVFRGVAGYVSPNWYPSKQATHRQVPTWNYEVVHAHGRLRIRDDERFLRGLLARLTRVHEAAEPRPWKMGDAPSDYLDAMLQAVVGIEIELTRLEGKAKLSQNKETGDRLGAVAALRRIGHDALADAMARDLDEAAPDTP